jgi:hypothetical protein
MSVQSPVIERFDLLEKEIYLKVGVRAYHPVEDIYTEVRNLRRNDESLRVFDMPVKAFGNIPKGGGKFTPRYAVFYNGWKVVPEDITHSLTVTGEQITDDGQSGEACIYLGDMSIGNSVFIQYYPPSAEIVRDEVSLQAIAHMSFDNTIWHDHVRGTTIAGHAALSRDPNLLGNTQYPVSDENEMMVIAEAQGIRSLRMTGAHNMLDAIDLTGYRVHGDSAVNDGLILGNLPVAVNVEFTNLTLSGVLDGGATIRDCLVNGLTYFNGITHQSALQSAAVTLGGTGTAMFLDCFSAVAGGNDRPTIDFDSQETNLAIRGWSGGLELVNKTTVAGNVSVDMSSGILYIRDSCTAGQITVRGLGQLVDESTGTCIVEYAGLLDPDYVQQLTFEDAIYYDEHDLGSAGTVYPQGTPAHPINNVPDMLTVSLSRGIPSFHILEDVTFTVAEVPTLFEYSINGLSHVSARAIMQGSVFTATTFTEITVMGTFGAGSFASFRNCILHNTSGLIYDCHDSTLKGTLSFDNVDDVNKFINCDTDDNDGAETIFDFAGSDSHLVMQNFSGKVRIMNMTSATASVHTINMVAGKITFDASCTEGLIHLRGVGYISDESTGNFTVDNDLISLGSISSRVWDVPMLDHTDAGSTGSSLSTASSGGVDLGLLADAVWTDSNATGLIADAETVRKHTTNKAIITSNGTLVTVYDDDGISILHQFDVTSDKLSRTPR